MDYIGQAVTQLVGQYGTNDPYRLAQAMGIAIKEVSFESIGGLTMELAGKSIVLLNSNSPEWSKRFVLAHEIGHRQLSPTGGYFFLKTHTFMQSKIEHQANCFAVELLTYGQDPEPDETLEQFMLKVGIPSEMMYLLESLYPEIVD